MSFCLFFVIDQYELEEMLMGFPLVFITERCELPLVMALNKWLFAVTRTHCFYVNFCNHKNNLCTVEVIGQEWLL